MRVAIAFNDVSMGGTSRSAVTFADAWHLAGAEAIAYCPGGPHPSRTAQLKESGIPVTAQLGEITKFRPDLLHIHHGAPSGATTSWVGNLLSATSELEPAVLTHDIFGQGLGAAIKKTLRASSVQPQVVGLLGDWLAAQHSAQCGGQGISRRIIPNPQDFSFFRPPSSLERKNARARRGISNSEKVLLRVGSPINEKWTIDGYIRLAEFAIKSTNYRLRLIGAPPKLLDALPRSEKIDVLPVITDDEQLREEYWTANTFMHWADRGESFGNVILEALGTRLPVAYRSRALRDNTPWEFQKLKDFSYASGTKSWLSLAAILDRSAIQSIADVPGELEEYGVRRLSDVLSDIVWRFDSLSHMAGPAVIPHLLEASFRVPQELPKMCQLQVALRHNPVSAKLKDLNRRFNV
ncbi:hypothetical protein [Arthrobacter sp. PsM3]|uniref:hypothetical protein n=1 Tax=Arthrobacter sp. PsM3 TaxID=3030531 RepID=UPI00263B77D6|nr:hypothetical protein [Arthrobacter sp. PsM3]MDN4646524.1 hypothetical protein [Arthrobacter sp. PsM3]